MEKPGPEIQLAHCGASATYRTKDGKAASQRLWRFLFTIYDSLFTTSTDRI
jgi:hypothetical protein